jgi:hypothetical protein
MKDTHEETGGFRDLKAGDEIQEGDEYLNGNAGGWEPVDHALLGKPMGIGSVGCFRRPATTLERLANILDMPAGHVREAAEQIRTNQMKERLMEKVRVIRSGNTAITPTGEIVDRDERPDAMPYETNEAPAATERIRG